MNRIVLSIVWALSACTAPSSSEVGAFHSVAPGQFEASAPRYQAHFDAQGLHARSGEDTLGLQLTQWGREQHQQPLTGLPPRRVDDHLEVIYPGIVELWTATDGGIRQSWRIDQAPTGDGALVLQLQISEATDWRISADQRSATIIGSTGKSWQYRDLRAWDAVGVPLSAHLASASDGLSLWIDAPLAEYPVTIDPELVLSDRIEASDQADFDEFGGHVSAAGDVNGDGYDDIIVGAQYDDNGGDASGTAYLYYGSAFGLDDLSEYILNPTDSAANQRFGVVSEAGDVNGDGFDDVLIGAPGDSQTANNAGAAYVYLGSAAGLVLSTEVKLLAANGQAGDGFGHVVSAAGDVNGDGYDDVLIGAPGTGNERGGAYLFAGSSAGILGDAVFLQASDSLDFGRFGVAIAGAGDVNADGYDDLLVGSPGANGAVASGGAAYLYLGSATGPNAASEQKFYPGTATEDFGISIAGAGDLNGDGTPDALVGDTNATASPTDPSVWIFDGAGYVFLGSSSGYAIGSEQVLTALGGSPDNLFAATLSGIGDADGDGYDDLVIGAEEGTSPLGRAGHAHFYFGSAVGPSGTADFDTGNFSALYGFASDVSGAGDVNGDGVDEAIIGVGRDDDMGSVWIETLCTNPTDWYYDGDNDNRGDPNIIVSRCNWPTDYTNNADDCDDSEPLAWTGRSDYCDGVDNDCDGLIDNGPWVPDYYLDADFDGYGDPATWVESCTLPFSHVLNDDDCDDTDFLSKPGGIETCDGRDNNCNGQVDEYPIDGTPSYSDLDGDGRGDPDSYALHCDSDPTQVFNADDCNDNQPLAWENAPELCDNVDNNCDGLVDRFTDDAFIAWYFDYDGDGFTGRGQKVTCVPLVGYPEGTVVDCDDSKPDVYPGAPEALKATEDRDCIAQQPIAATGCATMPLLSGSWSVWLLGLVLLGRRTRAEHTR